MKRKCWLEIKSQVGGDDGDVGEVNDVVHLSPVQVLVDVQGLQGRPEQPGEIRETLNISRFFYPHLIR